MDKESLPDYYMYSIGLMVQEATVTEGLLCTTLMHLTKLDRKLAEAIFYTADAFPTRKNLLLRVLTAIDADKETVAVVNEILKNVEKCNNKRAELAHSTIGYAAGFDGPIQTRAKLQGQQRKPITKAYINSVLSEASQASQRAFRAYNALADKILGPPKLRPS
jgi:hypothetical protein